MKSKKKKSSFGAFFNKFSSKVTRISGSPAAFMTACSLIIIWGACGPIFGFSDTWQLVINTSTTIITFLMVFVIQQTQNKDTMAVHLKLNELIAANERTSNRLIDIEDLTEEELNVIKKFYVKLSKLAETETDIHATHSLDEAKVNHSNKLRGKKPPSMK